MNGVLQVLDPAHGAAILAQLTNEIHTPAFWFAVGKIIWINVLLSGDNALVIALACRGLHPRQRFWGMVIGAGIAVVLLISFTAVVATLMALPYLKLIGGLALVVIAARLLVPEDEDNEITAGTSLWHAVRIVVIADIVMSLDNVIAVAAAANGQLPLLILGLAISIPIIVAGAALIMALLDKLPILVWLGAALLGWVAGDAISTDPGVHPMLQRLLDGDIVVRIDAVSAALASSTRWEFSEPVREFSTSLLCAVIVLVWGGTMRRRRQRAHDAREAISASSGEVI
ncbi:MAG: TerC family protein [Xanthobacteraceae bacterium]|nr:TerC family protein [Xanthobacteraceae bacterium]